MTDRPARPDARWPRRVSIFSTALAVLSLGLLVATAVILTVPVSNRPVQDCGAPGLFLLRGTPDAALTDARGNPLHGLKQSELDDAYKHRCTKIVGTRAAPAALTGAGFLLLGLVAFVLALVGRSAQHRRALARWWGEQAGPDGGQAPGRTTSSGVPM